MSMWAVDPRRPRINGAAISCPECGQAYDVIAEGFERMPLGHLPGPRRSRRFVGYENFGSAAIPLLCPVRSDELLRLLFIAQLEAEIRKEAA